MQLYFIRHAQSQNNALYDQSGSENGRKADPEITDLGLLQAQKLGDFFAKAGPGAPAESFDLHNREGFGFTHLYCSLMLRSIQTGSVVAEYLGLPLLASMDLHEGGGIFLKDEESGEYIGLPGNAPSYLQDRFPDLHLPAGIPETGWWNRPIETLEQRIERAARLISDLLKRHDGTQDRIALISHGGFYNVFMSQILEVGPRLPAEPGARRQGIWLSLNNVGISRIDWGPDEVRLAYHNRLDFLPTELIS